jgi:hypothetical protein
VAAAAANELRGNKGGDTISEDDLAAAVKFVHLKKSVNRWNKSSQVNTLPKAKSKTRSKQNKDMHKFNSVYSERGVPLPVLTSGGE